MTNLLLKHLIWRSARIPLLIAIMGAVIIGLSLIDNVASLTQWQPFFDLTDKLGAILIALAFIAFLYNASILILKKYELRFGKKNQVISLILASLIKSLRIIFILIAINVIIYLAAPEQSHLLIANKILNVIIIAAIGWMILEMLYTSEAVFYQYTLSIRENPQVKAFYTKMHIIRNIATFLIIIITIAAILMSFSSVKNIGISLLASAGFLTAILGFSAQKTLSSFFYGLQIAFTQPIKIGDFVVIENVSGIVEEITLTFVRLTIGDNRKLIVPINYFIEKPFENWSSVPNSLTSSLHFYVDYLFPIDALRQELNAILQKSTYWDGKANKLQVSNLTERSAEIRIQVSAANADDLSELRAELREKILQFIRDTFPDHFPKMRYDGESP